MEKMSAKKNNMMWSALLLQFLLILFQFQDTYCKTDDTSHLEVKSTIFDPHVLNRVQTLFTRSLQTTTAQTGQKKSIITTAENSLHLKVDPRKFGNSLLKQANENAARKSDIYMNKAIDATALGVAVLKLIFGKDAKMVMKDADSKDAQASLRTSEPRPQSKITLWPARSPFEKDHGRDKAQTKDKIGKLSMNILKVVKNFQPSNSETGKGNSERKSFQNSLDSSIVSEDKEKGFSGSESNLERLLSLMQKSTKNEKGAKKSWVLLKVPSKQPQDELGMLNDPVATEDNGNDKGETLTTHEDTGKIQSTRENTGKTRQVHHKHKDHKGRSHGKESSTELMTRIQDQVKHLANIVSKQHSQAEESTTATKHRPAKQQQSKEGKSFTSSIRVGSKSLKTEPFQEVNAVKTTTHPKSYENSVKNLLRALKISVYKHNDVAIKRQQKVALVPLKKKEETATSKDVVTGANPASGAVVSLDALRQLGQLLGLSSQQADEKKISPYTGTQDTLTLATAMPPEALAAQATPTTPQPPHPPPTTPSVQYKVSPRNTLNRISEQLKMFAERGLRGHNDYRRLHHAEPLKWSEDLASAAEKLAYQAAKKGTTRRSELVEKKGFGENVAKIANTALENAGEEATRHWYNEKQNFTFSDPVIDEGTKAFTQMIWKGTQTLGMGTAKDDDTGELYVVALYSPKGNDQATLRENLASDGTQHQDVYASIFKKSLAPHYK